MMVYREIVSTVAVPTTVGVMVAVEPDMLGYAVVVGGLSQVHEVEVRADDYGRRTWNATECGTA
jgi:hypothetical protein